jgi:hypothetical protein
LVSGRDVTITISQSVGCDKRGADLRLPSLHPAAPPAIVATMEVVLQWLDELDDLAFAMFIGWRKVCRSGLSLGLAAALLLVPGTGTQLQAHWVVALSVIALVSVLAWTTAAVSLAARPATVHL